MDSFAHEAVSILTRLYYRNEKGTQTAAQMCSKTKANLVVQERYEGTKISACTKSELIRQHNYSTKTYFALASILKSPLAIMTDSMCLGIEVTSAAKTFSLMQAIIITASVPHFTCWA